jgi:hypothetical protein
LPQIVFEGFAIPQRMRLRHIPGSPPAWLLGHMLRVKLRHRLFLYEMWQEMGAEHGKIFKWFWGTQPVITIRGAAARAAARAAGAPRTERARGRAWRLRAAACSSSGAGSGSGARSAVTRCFT